MNHYIVIRSAYSPNSSIELNEYRLSITERWCVPSLAAQTNKDFAIELRTNCADPLIVDVRHKHNRSTTAPSMRGGHPLHEIREVFPCALL